MDEKNKDLVKAILATESPSEVFAVDFYVPPKSGKSTTTANGPLGIGVEVAVVAILPVVWKIIDELTKEARKETTTALGVLAKRYWQSKIEKQLLRDKQDIEQLLAPVLTANGIPADRSSPLSRAIMSVLIKA